MSSCSIILLILLFNFMLYCCDVDDIDVVTVMLLRLHTLYVEGDGLGFTSVLLSKTDGLLRSFYVIMFRRYYWM